MKNQYIRELAEESNIAQDKRDADKDALQ